MRNLQGGVQVELLAGRKGIGLADTCTDHGEVEQALRSVLHRMPGDARYYDMHLDQNGQPDSLELQRASREMC